MAGRFISKSIICTFGLRSVLLLNRTTEGFLSLLRANSVPKSVSAETIIRLSLTALSKIIVSSAQCSPKSLTWTASWPALFNPSAINGDSALSIRNLTRLLLKVSLVQ